MGRYIYEGNNFVWKYVFGRQNSEQSRINTEYDIGKLSYLCPVPCPIKENCSSCPLEGCPIEGFDTFETNNFGEADNAIADILELSIDDIPVLQEIIDNMKNYEKAKSLYNDFWEKENGRASFDKVREMEEETHLLCEDLYFGMMIERMIKHMKESYKKDKSKKIFRFEGEY